MQELKFDIINRNHFQQALLKKVSTYRNVVFLNDNGKQKNHLAISNSDALMKGAYQFGFVSYDYKNKIEQLSSTHDDYIGFPEHHLFSPELHFIISENDVVIRFCQSEMSADSIADLMEQCNKVSAPVEANINVRVDLNARLSKQEYISKVEALQQHIQLGDIYEVNFCQEFYAQDAQIEPIALYVALNEKSPTPFSCFVKHQGQYLFCASPERYIQKTGERISSQPIKGTIARGKDDLQDQLNKEQLQNDPKERSENVMIVDLVRNDLAKISYKNSVKVDELMGVYTFPQVHQLISTISAKVEKNIPFSEVLKATFPMGSMTGAPKIRAMELIEQYEVSKRGLYSGTVGYITPENDFDFNVVIRSITFNSKNKYLSYMVGGAITALSIPENEYNECLLKAQAMREVLSQNSD